MYFSYVPLMLSWSHLFISTISPQITRDIVIIDLHFIVSHHCNLLLLQLIF